LNYKKLDTFIGLELKLELEKIKFSNSNLPKWIELELKLE